MDLHSWRISDGTEDDHGYGVNCSKCNLELVPCVDLYGRHPLPLLYVAGRSEPYDPDLHPCEGWYP